MDLHDRNAVVIGGATGIGAGICSALIARGARVHLGDIDFEGAKALAAQYPDGAITPHHCDVTSADSLVALEAAVRATGPISLVFVNAGAILLRPFLKSTDEDWQWLFNVNTFGVVRSLRTFLPNLLTQDDASRIVITSSITALRPVEMGVMTLYTSSKSAHLGLVHSLRKELAGSKVDVSIVLPGSVQSALVAKSESTRPGAIQIEGPVKNSGTPLQPEEAGEIILKGVEAGAPFIATHQTDAEAVREMQEEIMGSFAFARP